MANTVDLRTYIKLEKAFTRRLQRSWRIMSAPIYQRITQACLDHKWDEARRLVTELDMAEVGTQNREWITFMLRSCGVFGASIISKRKPNFVGVGSFDTFLRQTTQNMLQYLEYRGTAQVQAEALQSIAEDEAKTKAEMLKAAREYVRDDHGRFAEVGSSNTAIGAIINGEVRTRNLKGRDPYLTTHDDNGWGNVPASSRFRYNHGEILWLDLPGPDEYFAVDDHFAGKGWPVKGHYGEVRHNLIPAPKPTLKRDHLNKFRRKYRRSPAPRWTEVVAGIGGITLKFDEAAHPRGEDGRFIEASQPRIFNRPDELLESKGWPGDSVRYVWKDPKTGEGTGRLLTGEPLTAQSLPETLYHVTTNAPAVEASGVLLGLLEDGGLGGGQAPGVSFTSDPKDAVVIQRELRRAVQIAQGSIGIDDLERFAREDEQEAGLPEGALKDAVLFGRQQWDGNEFTLHGQYVQGKGYDPETPHPPEEKERLRRSLMKDTFNAYLQIRGHQDVQILKNPIIFGRQEHLAKLKPENIRTLTIPSANIPEGALITSGSDKFLHEVRAYSDVPLRRRLQSVAKFDEQKHPRVPAGSGDPSGQFTETGRVGTPTSDPVLAEQAKQGIAAVEKLLPQAIVEADYSAKGGGSWEDVDDKTQNHVRERWMEDAFGNAEVDTSNLDADVKNEVQQENQEILDKAVEDTLKTLKRSEEFGKDTDPVLPIEGASPTLRETFNLKRQLDPDTLSYGDGDHEDDNTVTLDLEALRWTSGEPLTPDEQDQVKYAWIDAYQEHYNKALDDAYQSDSYTERRNELENEAVQQEWDNLSDSDKYDYMTSHDLGKAKGSPGEPEEWITGIEDGGHEDQNYARTHAIALKLAELRTDQIREERGLNKPGEKPFYTIEDQSVKLGPLAKANFVIYDSSGQSVGASNTLAQATINAEEWAKAAANAQLNIKTPVLISNLWKSWKGSSSEGLSLSLQLAISRELGGLHRMTEEEVEDAVEESRAWGGIPVIQAYVRAQWETTQMVMQKAGQDKVEVYRGLMLAGEQVNSTTQEALTKNGDPVAPPKNIAASDLPKPTVAFDFNGEHFVVERERSKPKSILDLPPENASYEQVMAYTAAHPLEPVEAAVARRVDKYYQDMEYGHGFNGLLKLPEIQLKRAGAQSTTGDRKVANDWGGVGNLPPNPTRVVLRIAAPATSVFSLPVYGQNVQEEHESVIIGAKDKWLWDAWRRKAPEFSRVPIVTHPRSNLTVVTKAEAMVIDLQAEDRGKPHWMSSVNWAEILQPVAKFDSARHPRHPAGSAQGGEFTRVAMTSQRGEGDPGHQSNREVFQHMREFEGQLKLLPGVSRVSVKPGVGGWEGGSESMWQIYYRGNGAARKLVAQTAKHFNQDAVLILGKCGGGQDCQPAVELSFAGAVSPTVRDHVHKILVANGIGGWTWMKRNGKTLLRMVSVPQWGGEATKHKKATALISKQLREDGLLNSRHVHNVAVSVMEREGAQSYDQIIGR